jgi:hypothetical protein
VREKLATAICKRLDPYTTSTSAATTSQKCLTKKVAKRPKTQVQRKKPHKLVLRTKSATTQKKFPLLLLPLISPDKNFESNTWVQGRVGRVGVTLQIEYTEEMQVSSVEDLYTKTQEH